MFLLNKKVRRQEIRYAYSDANMIEAINTYLTDFKEKDFKLLKLSFIFSQRTIIIIFKSSFETRKKIADKLRQYDSDAPLLRMQRLMETDKKSEDEELKRYESLPIQPIEEEIEDNGERLNAGDVVIHFKGGKYLILDMNTMHTETKERLVIYQAMNADKKVYARPYKMFMGKVDKKKYPDVKQKYRLELYTDEHRQKEEEEQSQQIGEIIAGEIGLAKSY